jgi:2-polyprenyl-3-methyl-5-hydroxy-6-metoxy-1,4-benzoquinol methylase
MSTNSFDTAATNWDSAQYRVERAQHIARQILTMAPKTQHGRVLDFGCGTGLLGFNFVDNAQHIVFADTSTGMLAQVEQKAKAQSATNVSTHLIASAPLPGKFDLIVSLMVLHHIEDHAASIRELCALLAPGGQIFLCDLESEDGSFHGETIVPHKGFAPASIAEILRACGLNEVRAPTVHVDEKIVNGLQRQYPIFMASGQQ